MLIPSQFAGRNRFYRDGYVSSLHQPPRLRRKGLVTDKYHLNIRIFQSKFIDNDDDRSDVTPRSPAGAE